MAKRVAKPAKKSDVKTLGQMFGDEPNVRFTIVGGLLKLQQKSFDDACKVFDLHVLSGNIVFAGLVGRSPGVQTYRIAKPDAPAIP